MHRGVWLSAENAHKPNCTAALSHEIWPTLYLLSCVSICSNSALRISVPVRPYHFSGTMMLHGCGMRPY